MPRDLLRDQSNGSTLIGRWQEPSNQQVRGRWRSHDQRLDNLRRPSIRSLVDRDNRQAVSRLGYSPFCFIAQVLSYVAGGTTRSLGSGFLIAPDRLVTAAHNFFLRGQRADRWEVYFMLKGDRSANNVYAYTGYTPRLHPRYRVADRESRYDVATLQLQPVGRPLPRTWGVLRVVEAVAGQLDRQRVLVSGYPLEVPAAYREQRRDDASQYFDFGILSGHRGGLVRHNADTTAGQSGSPLVVRIESDGVGHSAAAGLHVRGSATTTPQHPNIGLPFERDIADFIFSN